MLDAIPNLSNEAVIGLLIAVYIVVKILVELNSKAEKQVERKTDELEQVYIERTLAEVQAQALEDEENEEDDLSRSTSSSGSSKSLTEWLLYDKAKDKLGPLYGSSAEVHMPVPVVPDSGCTGVFSRSYPTGEVGRTVGSSVDVETLMQVVEDSDDDDDEEQDDDDEDG